MILSQDQRLKDLDHRSKITEVIFYMSKDPDHFNDLDLLAKRSPIFPIYVSDVILYAYLSARRADSNGAKDTYLR